MLPFPFTLPLGEEADNKLLVKRLCKTFRAFFRSCN